jgi:hypothetical protein
MPSLNFGDAPTWLQWVIAVAAVITLVGGAIRLIPPAWRAVRSIVTLANDLEGLPQELAELRKFREETSLTLAQQNTTLAQQDTKVTEIHHEVHYNDGSSVKDATLRIELGVKGLYGEVDQLKAADEEIRTQLNKKEEGEPK